MIRAALPNLTLAKLASGWWILGIPEAPPAGPYNTRAEAEASRRGMLRFFRFEDKPGYVTSDPRMRR